MSGPACTINLEPYESPRPRFSKRGRFVRVYMEPEYVAWKQTAALIAQSQKFILADEFDVVFYLPVPGGKKYAKRIGTPHQQKPDTDNLLKSVMDALRPDDDQKIHTVSASKVWCPCGMGRIEIWQ